MQIVIPMSGEGSRFKTKGYVKPKPLIEVDGKPLIEHVVSLFPGESDFLFVCNAEHLRDPALNLRSTLKRIAPNCVIAEILPHKLGPVHAIRLVREKIKLDVPVIVNYCDFFQLWDWEGFKRFLRETEIDGCIPAYRGFHPHSLGSNNYAYLKEESGYVVDIKEKEAFTDTKMEEYASTGTYYFSSGRLMLDAFDFQVKRDLSVNGEFYVSLAFHRLFDMNLSVKAYAVSHFMQWGTPEDLQEYQHWSECLRNLRFYDELRREKLERIEGSTVLLAAGLGQRFQAEGYVTPKALIAIEGYPMGYRALQASIVLDNLLIVGLAETEVAEKLYKSIDKNESLTVDTLVIESVTEGQAISARRALEHLPSDEGVVHFVPCDGMSLYDECDVRRILSSDEWDVICWVAKPNIFNDRHPDSYGWVTVAEDNTILDVSVKRRQSLSANQFVLTGGFSFRTPDIAKELIDLLVEANTRVNSEFYLDSVVQVGLDRGMACRAVTVDDHISWGTPSELKTFQYWRKAFDLQRSQR